MVGVANNRAEFGPRALGNRSLLADPRGQNMQDLVNTVKQRQAFRPFAPVIKEECLHDYFDMPEGVTSSPFMQFVGKTKDPEKFPAITHVDGTARVQTVTRKQHAGLYKLLDKWHEATGCPMLLNTSLNIKGEPMVNTEMDAARWTEKYKVEVVTREQSSIGE
jgi:carbamoyltransferase